MRARGSTCFESSRRRPVSIGWLIRVLTSKISSFATSLGACTRGCTVAMLTLVLPIFSGTAVGIDLDPSLGHQHRPVAHFGGREHVLRFGKPDASRDAGSTAQRGELKAAHEGDWVSR